MKPQYLLILLFTLTIFILGCDGNKYEVKMAKQYSSQEDFVSSLKTINGMVKADSIMAYLDSLENGDPDTLGEKIPLTEFVGNIISLAESGQLEEAVYEVYHFDGTPFSLISYLMKAEMVGDIDLPKLADIFAEIPLPPLQDSLFLPPSAPVPGTPPDPCPCAPEVKILATWAYKPKCGNYTESVSGFAANNTLNNMKRMTAFRLDAEVHGCDEGGTWTNTSNCPANIMCRSNAGNSVTIIAGASGTVTVTFTYTCTCVHECRRQATETFSLNFR